MAIAVPLLLRAALIQGQRSLCKRNSHRQHEREWVECMLEAGGCKVTSPLSLLTPDLLHAHHAGPKPSNTQQNGNECSLILQQRCNASQCLPSHTNDPAGTQL